MNSRTAFVLVVLCVVARPLVAQPIHGGCPDYNGIPTTTKAAYGSPAEWPTLSAQMHAGGPGYNSMPSMLAHTHTDLAFPYCGEFGAQFITVPYSQTLFMTQGHIDRLDSTLPGYAGNVVSFTVSTDPAAFRQRWFGTVTAGPNHPAWPMPTNTTGYPLVGNDSGVAIIEGDVTLDLGFHFNGIKNGWTDVQVASLTTYDSGQTSLDLLTLPFDTTEDPTAPPYYGFPHTMVSTHTVFTKPVGAPDFNFGSNSVFELSALPVFGDLITPANPKTVIVTGYAYTATQSNFSRNLVDANLHAGSLGIVYGETTHGVTVGSESELDPTFPGGLSPGIHSDLAQWEVQGPPGFEDIQEWANLKFFFVVGEGGTPLPPSPLTISQPPNLTVPLLLTVPVPFSLPTTTGGTAPVTVTCSPVSGSPFSIGTTPVSCTATDSGGQSAGPVTFSVTVTGP